MIHDAVDAIAGPARSTEQAVEDLADSMTAAGVTASEIPLVGEGLKEPFDSASGTLEGLGDSAAQQVASIERVADISAWVVLLIPVRTVLVLWLPARLRFFTTARATRRYIDAAADLDLFALRAMATQPTRCLHGSATTRLPPGAQATVR